MKPLHDKAIGEAARAEGRDLARRCSVLVRRHKRLGYVGTVLEYPTVFSSGQGPEVCIESTYDALAAGIATMLDAGVTPREPFKEWNRTEQMNIRLDVEEKLLLRETALQRGYRSASDYVRVVALRDARQQGVSSPEIQR